MSRIVSPRPAGARFFSSGGQTAVQEWAERVAKYVPAEITVVYLAIYALLKPMSESCEEVSTVSGFLGFTLLCWCLCPLYISRIASTGEKKRLHMLMSALAFPIWVYAMGGIADCFPEIQNAKLGGMLLAGFTLISGLFAPGSRSR